MKQTIKSIMNKLLNIKLNSKDTDEIVDPDTGYRITKSGDFSEISYYLRRMGFEVYWLCEMTGKQIALIIDKALYVCSNKKELDSKYHEIYMNDISLYKEYENFSEEKDSIFGLTFKDYRGFEYCWKKL